MARFPDIFIRAFHSSVEADSQQPAASSQQPAVSSLASCVSIVEICHQSPLKIEFSSEGVRDTSPFWLLFLAGEFLLLVTSSVNMIDALSSGSFVCPGDVLVTTARDGICDPCGGCFVEEGSHRIRASIAGKVLIEEELGTEQESRFRVSVSSARNQMASETVIDVGDKVTCRVVRLSMNQANLEIISVGDCPLQQSPKGIIRREDVRLSDIEKLIMSECFRPGDILRGVIISLGDSRQYYVSTSDADHGVLYAKSLITGNLMDPLSHKVSSMSNYLMSLMTTSILRSVLSTSVFASNRLCYEPYPYHLTGNG